MDYFRSKRFLDTLDDWESGRPGSGDVTRYLPRMRALLERLGSPQSGFRSIIVGGTNGKGTVSSLLAALLRAAGWRTGLYTSPHLHTQRERIQLHGELCTKEQWAEGMDTLYDRTRGFASHGLGEFTRFEALTGLAALLFARYDMEFAVFEVGLGGQYDATNAWDSEMAVLTSVSVDHVEVLGTDPVAIAADKLHIARPGKPLFTSVEQTDAVMARIRAEATARDLRLHVVEEDGVRDGDGILHPWLWPPQSAAGRPATYAENARLAVAAATHLAGARLPAATLRDVVTAHQWPGRFERVRETPLLILDGAHNPQGGRRLAADLRTLAPEWTFVVGFGSGHDVAGTLTALAPLARHVVLTSSDHPKAADPRRLAASVPPGLSWEVVPDCGAALTGVLATLTDTDCCCVTGSLHLVARIREQLDLPLERDGITEEVARESLVCLEQACGQLGIRWDPISADGNVMRATRGGRCLHFLRNKNPFNDYVAGRLAEDKGYQHEIFTRTGVPIPRTLQVFNPLADARFDRYKTHGSVADIVRAAEDALSYPMVVKKYRSSLAQGVYLEADAAALSRRLREVFANASFLDNIVMLQEFVAGPEYRIVASGRELLLAYGKVSDDDSGGADLNPLHQADGEAVPVHDAVLLQRLRDLTVQVASGLELGFYAIDLIDSPGGLRVLEINPNPFCYFYNRSNGRADFVRIYVDLLERFLPEG